uniref:Piwi-like RNA-mediated gene silencing 2 n=1 Tax=Salarias fasciatus TaxID=181472 RepID=A0A672IZP5_SALFA
MDPSKPPDSSDKPGIPWLGRGRGLQPQDLAVGRGRGQLLLTESQTVGQARSFSTPGDHPHGRGVTLPMTTYPVIGRARGLLAPHDQSVVGLARGLLLSAPEPQIGVSTTVSPPKPDHQLSHAHTLETEKPGPAGDAPTVTKDEVRPTNLTLVSMFRGIGLEPLTSRGRGDRPVGHVVLGQPSPPSMGQGRAAPSQLTVGRGLPMLSSFPPGQVGALSSTVAPQPAPHPHPPESGIEPPNKAGTKGAPLTIGSNHIPVRCRNEAVYQYHVTFTPPVESMSMRFGMMKEHRPTTGEVMAFDGSILYLPVKLKDVVILQSVRLTDNEKIQIKIQMTKILPPNSDLCMPFYNVVIRRIMKILGLKLVGRNHYSPENAVILGKHRLQVWPGYETCMKRTDGGIYLSVTVSHKVLRNDSVLDVMNLLHQQSRENFKDECTKELVGFIVITRYNNRTYRIDNIEWNKSPKDTFTLMDGSKTTFVEYYSKNYGITIKELDQPLLIHRPKERSKPGGKQLITGEILLVPELSFLTGIPEKMKKDFRFMKDLTTHINVTTEQHLHSLNQLLKDIRSSAESVQELSRWGLELNSGIVQSRILPVESICLRSSVYATGSNASWAREVVNDTSISSVPLNTWVIIHPRHCVQQADELVSTFNNVARPIGFQLGRPIRLTLQNDRTDTYISMIQQQLTTPSRSCAVCSIPSHRRFLYSKAINISTISQKPKLRSIAQKVLMQMNAKLGGELWTISIPLKNMMVIGVDVHHNTSKNRQSVMGFVASVNGALTRWYSRVTFQRPNEELICGFRVCFLAALRKYYEVNHNLPDKIVVYRDGVSESQLKAVEQYEIPQLITCFKNFTDYDPKLTFIVVQKRISTTLYSTARGIGPPPPGTVLDHTLTSQNWVDFFLISHHIIRGCAVPTHYVTLHNTANLPPDHLQRLTFKMCHLYWNWPGTIRVPAPCKYAHKLAYLAGQYLHSEPAIQLSEKLFFL